MTKHSYDFRGQLTRNPFPNTPSKAQARMMPIECENDFDVFANLPASQAPILLNFSEHFQLLAELVKSAQGIWPEHLSILLRISMPSGMRLPAPMLEPNVLMTQEIEPELSKLKKASGHVLVIEDRFVRFQIERGDNDISLKLFSDSDGEQNRFNQWLAVLPQWGVEAL